MFKEDINKRRDKILEIIVSSYVNSALPIGSRMVSKILGLSSATIRNAMSDLEELGYIMHPHTSAGRIPTDKGYRCYIESIMRIKNITKQEERRIKEEYFSKRKSIEDVIKKTAEILSAITHHTGIILFPRFKGVTFKHIDLIHIASKKILVVLVTSSGVVRNFILGTKEEFKKDLDTIANLLNTSCYGLSLQEIKEILMKRLSEERDSSYFILQEGSLIIESLMQSYYGNELYMEGASHLLAQPEFEDAKAAKRILEAFEKKEDLAELMENDIDEVGVKIYIGRENRFPNMRSCSLVTSGYRVKNELVGRLGVIGPTRMEYSHLIPVVNYISEVVSRTLNELVE